jgi:ribose transport system permease protein
MSTAVATPEGRAAGIRRFLVDRPVVMLPVILVALLIACEVASSGYLSDNQLGSIVRLAAPLAILAAGQTLVMLTGGIDLSVANTATAAAYIMAGQGSQGTLTAILTGLGVGLLIGLVNGVGIGIFGVQPLIMTLGVAGITIGLLTVRAQEFITGVPLVPDVVRRVAADNLFWVVPKSLLVLVPLAAAILLGLRYTGYGRMLYAVGDNPVACRLAGVRTWQVLLATYALSGILAAIAGFLLVGLTNAADLGLANTYLLPSVAAVVIGGTSIFGGLGGYAGTIFGALILTVLDSLLTLLKSEQSVKQILYGTIILSLAALYARVQRSA